MPPKSLLIKWLSRAGCGFDVPIMYWALSCTYAALRAFAADIRACVSAIASCESYYKTMALLLFGGPHPSDDIDFNRAPLAPLKLKIQSLRSYELSFINQPDCWPWCAIVSGLRRFASKSGPLFGALVTFSDARNALGSEQSFDRQIDRVSSTNQLLEIRPRRSSEGESCR